MYWKRLLNGYFSLIITDRIMHVLETVGVIYTMDLYVLSCE